jgi:predicted TIM-barrel fold metal-dependent hydrolase
MNALGHISGRSTGLFRSYGDVVDASAEIISAFSPSEQEALFSKNAERFCRI